MEIPRINKSILSYHIVTQISHNVALWGFSTPWLTIFNLEVIYLDMILSKYQYYIQTSNRLNFNIS